MSSFCICKNYSHFFFSKNTCELDIVLTRTVNNLTTNELVKLTTLRRTGPWNCSSPDYKVLKVCYCDQSMSVVRLASSVVRRQQLASKDYASYTPGPIDSKLDRIQSTLVISNSKGLSEILRDIRSSTYQVCRIEEKNNLINHI